MAVSRVSSVSSRLCADAYLVAQALAGNDSNLIADALVGLEVESETRVVALDDDLGRLLDSLSPDATHFDRCEAVVSIGGGLVVLGVKSAVAESDAHPGSKFAMVPSRDFEPVGLHLLQREVKGLRQ